MSNPLDPEMTSPTERLEEAACLLARGILRRRLRAADLRQNGQRRGSGSRTTEATKGLGHRAWQGSDDAVHSL
jgi:hypothetical protein